MPEAEFDVVDVEDGVVGGVDFDVMEGDVGAGALVGGEVDSDKAVGWEFGGVEAGDGGECAVVVGVGEYADAEGSGDGGGGDGEVEVHLQFGDRDTGGGHDGHAAFVEDEGVGLGGGFVGVVEEHGCVFVGDGDVVVDAAPALREEHGFAVFGDGGGVAFEVVAVDDVGVFDAAEESHGVPFRVGAVDVDEHFAADAEGGFVACEGADVFVVGDGSVMVGG